VQRETTGEIRWQIFKRNCGHWVSLILVFWGMYVASLFGFSFRGRGQRIADAFAGGQRSHTSNVELIGAVAITILGGALMSVWVWRASLLARRGELISGTVRRLGGLSDFDPLRRIDFSYTYNGKAYSRKMCGGEKRERGTKINLLVDPQIPGRVMFACDVLPANAQDGTSG
jgi:hypothetical protein